MHLVHIVPTILLVLAPSLSAAAAQHPARGGAKTGNPGLRIDFSRVCIDDPGDGRTWARGRTYKACFDAESATYIPFLGSHAPRNFPVRTTLVEARVGGVPLALAKNGVSRTAESVTIDRGAIREVWRLALDSAEQTFEIDERPAAAGDVTLRIAIESELALRADGDGFALDGEHGGVRIGRATAIDVEGRRLDLAGSIEGASLRIDLPGEFVASARYPLVVDPMYTTHPLSALGDSHGSVDVACSTSSGDSAVAYEVAYSASDSDIFTQDLFFGAPNPNSFSWVDLTSVHWYDPHIAHNGAENTYLTVATVAPATGASEIWCRARDMQTGIPLPQRLVASHAERPLYYNDVGGDPALTGPTSYLAVWTRQWTGNDRDILAQIIDPFGVTVGPLILIANGAETDRRPRVSESAGVPAAPSRAWNITWERENGGESDILGARVDPNGNLVSPAFAISQSFLFDDTGAAPSTCLDDGAGIWMVAFQRNASDDDVWVKVLSGSNVLAQANLSAIAGSVAGWDQAAPRIDSNGQRFVVTYTQTLPIPAHIDAYASTLAWAQGAIRVDEGHEPIMIGLDQIDHVEIANGHNELNPGFNFYALGWRTYLGSSATGYCGAYYEPPTYEAFCSGDGTFGACPCGNVGPADAGCPNSVTAGGVLVPSGESSMAYDTLTLAATELPATTTCLFFQGTSDTAPGALFGDGLRCAGGTVVRIASKTASGGAATYPEPGDVPISVRGSIPAGGAQRRYQVWYRNAAAFCTSATFNTTNGVRVRWLL